MNRWAMRIKQRMKALGLTQEKLAYQMGLTRGAITHYLAGRRVPPLTQFQKLAAILKADPAWLQFGTRGKEKEQQRETDRPIYEGNKHQFTCTRPAVRHTMYPIPVLTWGQVANYFSVQTPLNLESIVASCIPHFYTDQPYWYALRIPNDAMTAPLTYGYTFHEGDLIVVDPDAKVNHGNYVIALVKRAEEITFKQYVIDSGVHYLKPLNPQYPMIVIDDQVSIYGVVVTAFQNIVSF